MSKRWINVVLFRGSTPATLGLRAQTGRLQQVVAVLVLLAASVSLGLGTRGFGRVQAADYWPGDGFQQSPQSTLNCRLQACEITLTKIATLSDRSHSLHSPVPTVVQDRLGRFFVQASKGREARAFQGTDQFQIVAFDRGGKFLSLLEASLQSSRPVVASLLLGSGGSVLAWIPPGRQVYEIGENLKLTQSLRSVPYLPSFVRDDGTMVVAQQIQTSDLIGYPLHLIAPDGRVLRSFGSDTAEYRADLRLLMERVVTPSADGTVWASPKGRYIIERWNPLTGARLARVPVQSSWFVESTNYPSDNRTRPRPIVQALWERQGMLWVLIRDADAGWKPGANLEESWSPTRENRSYDWVLEVVDPTTGTVLASRRFDFALMGRSSQPFLTSYVLAQPGEAGALDLWKAETRRKETQ